MENRRNFLKIVTVFPVSGILFMGNEKAVAVEQGSHVDWKFEEEIADLIEDLSQLPKDLLESFPKDVENYEQRLQEELAKINKGRSLKLGKSSIKKSGTTLFGSPMECAVAAVPFFIEFGFPLAKILSVLNKARKSWGSIRLAFDALRRGESIDEIGEDAVTILEKILGIPELAAACTF